MGLSEFSVFTAFKARDGVSPVFKAMTNKGNAAGLQIAGSMTKAKVAIMAVKTACVAAAGAIAAVGAFVPLKAFADWEKGLATVETLLNSDEVAKYSNTLKELSKQGIRAGLSVEDVNTALFNSISAMGMSEKTLDVYQKSLVLAKGGAADLQTSISGMTAVINAWGAETTDATAVANAFFTAQKNGVTTVQELASNIGAIAPIAKAMGLSVDETMASLAALTKGGMSTDAATTGLRATLTALAKPSKEAEETLRAFGVPVGIAEVRAKGLTYTLQKLIELQKKSPNAITKAIPNVKALTGVLAMDESKMQEVHKTLGMIQQDIKNGTGLNEAFKKMDSTSAATMAKVMGELQIALIELGGVVAPYLMPLVKTFGEMVKWLAEMSPKLKDIIDKFIDFGNVVAGVYTFIKDNWLPLMLIMPAAIYAVRFAVDMLRLRLALLRMEGGLMAVVMKTKVMTALAGFTGAIWKSVTALWAQAAAFAATPIGMITIAIVALIGVVILLAKNWDKVKETVIGWWEKTKEILTGLWGKVKSVFSAIGKFVKEHFIDFLLMALGPIGQIVLAITKISSGIKSMAKGGKGIKVELTSGEETPAKKPTVKSDPQKGKIGVDVNLNNNTDINASVTTRVESSNNLQLQPQ
ncbi:MAG: phage tail tape measure protein [Bacteroidales bacterium]|nr:phage tail tape measure protein [Bacteroidales bacterium]